MWQSAYSNRTHCSSPISSSASLRSRPQSFVVQVDYATVLIYEGEPLLAQPGGFPTHGIAEHGNFPYPRQTLKYSNWPRTEPCDHTSSRQTPTEQCPASPCSSHRAPTLYTLSDSPHQGRIREVHRENSPPTRLGLLWRALMRYRRLEIRTGF